MEKRCTSFYNCTITPSYSVPDNSLFGDHFIALASVIGTGMGTGWTAIEMRGATAPWPGRVGGGRFVIGAKNEIWKKWRRAPPRQRRTIEAPQHTILPCCCRRRGWRRVLRLTWAQSESNVFSVKVCARRVLVLADRFVGCNICVVLNLKGLLLYHPPKSK